MRETIFVYKCDTCEQIIQGKTTGIGAATSLTRAIELHTEGLEIPLNITDKDFCSLKCLRVALNEELDIIQQDLREPYEGGK
jgi:hypothetical protein